jgi:hypothetical protein
VISVSATAPRRSALSWARSGDAHSNAAAAVVSSQMLDAGRRALAVNTRRTRGIVTLLAGRRASAMLTEP